jgi:RNA polymerase sigma-70 factor (ECF subfamily)
MQERSKAKPGEAVMELVGEINSIDALWDAEPIEETANDDAWDEPALSFLPGTGRIQCGGHGSPQEKVLLALYDEYRPRLYRYLRSMKLRREQAEEIVQETFMRLTMEMLKESEVGNMQGWIVRVAHNLAVNLLKKNRGPVLTEETQNRLLLNRADTALTPEESFSEQEQAARIREALSKLKPMHRECFQMRAQGFRYKDIGMALGISEQRAGLLVKQVAVRLAAICG